MTELKAKEYKKFENIKNIREDGNSRKIVYIPHNIQWYSGNIKSCNF